MSRPHGLVSHICGHQTPAPGPDRRSDQVCAGCRAVIGPRVVGGRYHCGYWNRAYTVQSFHYGERGGVAITVRWDAAPRDPEHCTTHFTAWDPKRDRVLRS